MEKIKVLYILGPLDYGGITSVIMNYYRFMDKDKFQIDFVVTKIVNYHYEKEIKKLSQLFVIPSYFNIVQYQKEIRKITKSNSYDIIHSNLGVFNFIPLLSAKKNVPIRIAHCHTTSHWKDGIRHIMKLIFKSFTKVGATHYFACSEDVGFWNFKHSFKNGYVIYNAIELEKYQFNAEKRKRLRTKYHLNNQLVFIQIGRLVKSKNYRKTLNTFSMLSKIKENIKLIIVGEGKLELNLRHMCAKLKIVDKVIFLGNIDYVNDILQAADIMLMPSIYEGLPLVAVEAQISNLNCFFSEYVPLESSIISTVKFIDLKDNWVDDIVNIKLNDRKTIYTDKFDIKKQFLNLENIYKYLKEGEL